LPFGFGPPVRSTGRGGRGVSGRPQPSPARADLDAALDRMYRDQRINLVSQADQMNLTGADRQAALRVGGKDKHRISFDPSDDPRHRAPA
jgi:hypothetical protein